VLNRIAIDHSIEEERPRSEIDNRRTGDSNRNDVAGAGALRRRLADISARPDHSAGIGMERINIV
jgi:hypothetical protein